MDLKSFESLIKSENFARLFLTKLCWKNSRRFCIRCRSRKIYRIIGKRFRCKRCGYTFHDFTGRWFNRLRISYKNWLWVIKLFEIELSARRIAQQTGLSYPTILKAINVIRAAIVASSSDAYDLLGGVVEMDESTSEADARANEAEGHPHRTGPVLQNRIASNRRSGS